MSGRWFAIRSQRERELAGDARAGTWARARAWRMQREFLTRNWFIILLLVGGILLISLLVALMMPTDLARGIALGVGLAAAPMSVWLFTIQLTGTAGVMMGDEAEQWTAQELRKLQRRGWRLVNHVALAHDDIDHVLVGPGGVVAVETKWSASWDSGFGEERLRSAAAQVQDNARRLQLWHPVKRHDVDVTPVVVFWGSAEGRRVGAPAAVNGVFLVAGKSLADWRQTLPSGVLMPEQIQDLWDELDQQVTRRDPVDRANNPLPVSFVGVAGQVGLSIATAILGLVVFANLWDWSDSGVVTLVGAALAIVPAAVMVKNGRWPAPSWAWIASLAIPGIALLLAYALDYLLRL